MVKPSTIKLKTVKPNKHDLYKLKKLNLQNNSKLVRNFNFSLQNCCYQDLCLRCLKVTGPQGLWGWLCDFVQITASSMELFFVFGLSCTIELENFTMVTREECFFHGNLSLNCDGALILSAFESIGPQKRKNTQWLQRQNMKMFYLFNFDLFFFCLTNLKAPQGPWTDF